MVNIFYDNCKQGSIGSGDGRPGATRIEDRNIYNGSFKFKMGFGIGFVTMKEMFSTTFKPLSNHFFTAVITTGVTIH